MKKVKHVRRKVTQEQVDAMNRTLELQHAGYRYEVGWDGRLSEANCVYYDSCCFEHEERKLKENNALI